MRRMPSRYALTSLPLVLGALAIGATGASANSFQWGDNGSDTCTVYQTTYIPGQGGAELGVYCMPSVTGWIQINGGYTQNQAISCANNAPGGSPGLAWSLDGQSYVNDGPWYQLSAPGNNVGWQTGSGSAALSGEVYSGASAGSNATQTYGVGGAAVTNFGGNGYWQAAVSCMNAAGASAQGSYERAPRGLMRSAAAAARVERARPVRVRDQTIDTIDVTSGTALRAREYALQKHVTRTDTRTCPAGMVRKGRLTYTVQEFPANHTAPKWKDRALVEVTMAPKGRNGGVVEMTLTKAKNPTVVQFQMRCGKA